MEGDLPFEPQATSQFPYSLPQFNNQQLHGLTSPESNLCDIQNAVSGHREAKSKTLKELLDKSLSTYLAEITTIDRKARGYVNLYIMLSAISLYHILSSISLTSQDKYFIHE